MASLPAKKESQGLLYANEFHFEFTKTVEVLLSLCSRSIQSPLPSGDQLVTRKVAAAGSGSKSR